MSKRSIQSCDQDENGIFDYHANSSDDEEEDQKLKADCAPDDEHSGTQWVFQGHLYIRTDNGTLFDPAPPLSSSVDNFPAAFQEIYFKNRPVNIECLQIFHDSSDLDRNYDTTRKCYLSQFRIRAYMQGKFVTRRYLENWLGDQREITWFKVDHILLHEDYCKDVSAHSQFQLLARFGYRAEFYVQSSSWYFKGCLTIDQASWIVMQDLEQVNATILACFKAESTIPYSEILIQLRAIYLTVHADIENLALEKSEHQVPIRGFLTGPQSKIAKYLTWLPSFLFKPICGSLRVDPRFRAAMLDMQSSAQTSKWIEVFTMGDLSRRARRKSDQVYNILNARNENTSSMTAVSRIGQCTSCAILQSSTRSFFIFMYRPCRILMQVPQALPHRYLSLQ